MDISLMAVVETYILNLSFSQAKEMWMFLLFRWDFHIEYCLLLEMFDNWGYFLDFPNNRSMHFWLGSWPSSTFLLLPHDIHTDSLFFCYLFKFFFFFFFFFDFSVLS